MAAGIKREQGSDFASALYERQDRNMMLTDGGILTWDAGLGELTWDQTLRVRVPGVGASTIAAGTLTGISTAGHAVYVDISRTATGALTPAVSASSSTSHLVDTRVVLAIRGTDSKLYFCNGTVFADGDSKEFGALNSVTDRDEVISNGLAAQTVGFTYVTGSDQLAVFVGGLLQKKGLHYNETSSTVVTFLAPYIPVSGELISFVNVVGGEGPPGTPTLQQAYDSNGAVDIVAGTPIDLTSTGGSGVTGLLRVGHASSVGGSDAFTIYRAGGVAVNQIFLRNQSTGNLRGVVENDLNGNTRIRSPVLGNEYGVQINADGSGIEFGVFASPTSVGTTGGAFKVTVLTGVTSAVAETVVASGLTNIKAVLASVYHSGLSLFLCTAFADLISVGRQFYVTFDAAGNINLSSSSDGTGVLTASMQGQAYNLIVFH